MNLRFRDNNAFRRVLQRALFALAFGPLVLAGCASNDDIDLSTYVEQTDPADQLYNQGLANLEAGRLKEASAKFKAVDREHPYSEFARKSLVMNAFTEYRQGNYEDSINSSRRYLTLYPNTDDAAYAQYIIGLNHFRQVRDVTQDQREAKLMIQAMNEVVERWPDSEYAPDAESKIRFGRDQLAGKEMQVGRYYLERREYIAAIKRFRTVIETYSNTRHIEEALARLTEAYLAMGIVHEAQTAAAVLGHNYPDSKWYKDAYSLLQKGGYSPEENQGSWISRAARRLTSSAS
ncbi:outer membrane protein assembly factor BamD [Zhengella mangrovi]|uniref:Outer membrane protein assembly factor BamD n=1 Tax=Zhengella mangrovi TaxID=1982044 RepID=A0A2G1QQ09_9HYPH|nr:outer membrane protein assembly factor BamD [Zhengella mangrovi]PHP67582.1 outer membrane protein assembly factor BamD [Zhengella mangrovi]